MKRVLFTLVGTVGGVVALLSYKSHGQIATSNGALPSAGLPAASSSGAAASSSGSATPSAPATAASGAASAYTGSAITTRYGIVQVKVTVQDKKITDVAFVQLTAFDGRSAQINSQAAPILLQETISAQSAQIDSVSGASYTSEGYIESLQSALDQAGIK